jgi:hypothetical protein
LALRGTLDALDLTGAWSSGASRRRRSRHLGPLRQGGEIHALDLVDSGSRAAVHAPGRVALGAEQPVLELNATWTER